MLVPKAGKWIALALAVGVGALDGSSAVGAPLSSRAAAEGLVTSATLDRDAKVGREEGVEYLLTLIVFWLSKNFELPAVFDHPKLKFAPAKRIAALRYGAAAESANTNDVVAIYHDKEKTIYLSERWSGNSPADVSVLVHEMVHHLQNFDKKIFLCAQAREKPAYDAQEKWLAMFGRSLASEFDLDPITVKVTTSCM